MIQNIEVRPAPRHVGLDGPVPDEPMIIVPMLVGQFIRDNAIRSNVFGPDTGDGAVRKGPDGTPTLDKNGPIIGTVGLVRYC